MKITYSKNPLKTKVELTEHEKEILWYKVKVEELSHKIYVTNFYLKESDHFNLEKARLRADPVCLHEDQDDKCPFDRQVDQRVEYLIDALENDHHCGDCTCVPVSCDKCSAENLVGVDTIQGLRSSWGSKLFETFFPMNKGEVDERSYDEVVELLTTYNPKKSEAWIKHDPTGERWNDCFPAWKEEAARALEWLLNYNETHFKDEKMS